MSEGTVSQELYFAVIPKAVLYHPDLKPSDIRVYGTLSERAGKKKRTWPGIRKIADDIHMSPDTVTRSIKRLEESGVIEIDRTKGESNHYWLPSVGVPKTSTPQDGAVPESSTPVYQESEQGVPESSTELDQITRPIELRETPNGVSTLDELKAELVEIFGEPPPQHWSLYNRVATWIRDQGGTPAEVRFKASCIAEEWGRKALTVTSLEKHWTRYDGQVGQITDADVERHRSEARRAARERRAQELDAEKRGLPG